MFASASSGSVCRLIIANSLSDQPNDKQQALPTLDAVPQELGKPKAVNMDNGYFSQLHYAKKLSEDIQALDRQPLDSSKRWIGGVMPWHSPDQTQPYFSIGTGLGSLIFLAEGFSVVEVDGESETAVFSRPWSPTPPIPTHRSLGDERRRERWVDCTRT